MQIIKRVLQILLWLMAGVLLLVALVLLLDRWGTSYLNIENDEDPGSNSIIITRANVIPMTMDTIIMNQSVYIKDGVITRIGKNLEVEGVEVYDAGQRFLLPGLIDMHVHVWDKYELGLYLANGITAVRNLWGMPMHLRYKKALEKEDLMASLMFTTGPKLTGPEFIGDDNLQLTSPDQGRQKVISYKDRGYDFIKTYYGLTEDIFEAIIEQSESSEIDIVAHPTPKVPYAYHYNPQIKSIEHAEDIVQQPLNFELDSVKLGQIINEYARSSGGAFCPTLISFYNIYLMLLHDDILSSDELRFMNPMIRMTDSKDQFKRWQNTLVEDSTIIDAIFNQHKFHLRIIKELHDSGISIICGTDAGIGITIPGASIHQELAFYKQCGLTNYEVLATATINASRTHEVMRSMGSIEEGKLANLILVEDNPLQDLGALKDPDVVFIKGHKLERETLKKYEQKAANRKNLVVSALRYLEYLLVEK